MEIKQIDNVVIVGAGIMGVGIAQSFMQAGLSVKLVDTSQSILDSSLQQIKTNLNLFQEYGLLGEKLPIILSRVKLVSIEALSDAMQGCNYVVEAIPEVLEVKKELFVRLEDISLTSIIATNTSSFTIRELSQNMRNPDRIIGVHYFNPAHIIPVVEIHASESTPGEIIELTRGLLLRTGKTPVMVNKVLPGFIVNRLTGALEREIDYLLDEGVVTPEDLDLAVKGSIGFRMACLGPQEIEDMIGLDTSMMVSRRVFKVLSNATEPSPQLVAKVKAGELGIKSGKGWYDYSGKPRTQVLDENNRKLLRQLAAFRSGEGYKL